MKLLRFNNLLIAGLLLCNTSVAQQKSKYYTISGIVTSASQYCGGAEPPQEVLNELSKPRPVASKELYIKTGLVNTGRSKSIKSLVTDSLGQFTIQLKKGSYCIVDKTKTKPLVIPNDDAYSKWDKQCLEKEYSKCDYQLEVADSTMQNVNIHFYIPCSWSVPCRQYNGPLPPSAPPVKE